MDCIDSSEYSELEEAADNMAKVFRTFTAMSNWFRHSPAFALIVSPDGTVTVNHTWVSKLGLPAFKDTMDLESFLHLSIHPDDVLVALGALEKLRSGGRDIENLLLRHKDFNHHQWRWHSWNASYGKEDGSIYACGLEARVKEPQYV